MTTSQPTITSDISMHSVRCLAAYSLLCVAVGCGPKINVFPASGTITLDGEPLAGVNISTQPVETSGSSVVNPGSQGRTDASGRFTLELQTDGTPGAVVGKHAVYITFGDNPTSRDQHDGNPTLPQEYWNGSLRCTVPEDGTDLLNFQLESKSSDQRIAE